MNWRDFLERVGWTAIQATAGAGLTVLSTGLAWQDGLKFVGVTVAIAVCKVTIAQQVGNTKTGDAFPGGVNDAQ